MAITATGTTINNKMLPTWTDRPIMLAGCSQRNLFLLKRDSFTSSSRSMDASRFFYKQFIPLVFHFLLRHLDTFVTSDCSNVSRQLTLERPDCQTDLHAIPCRTISGGKGSTQGVMENKELTLNCTVLPTALHKWRNKNQTLFHDEKTQCRMKCRA